MGLFTCFGQAKPSQAVKASVENATCGKEHGDQQQRVAPPQKLQQERDAAVQPADVQVNVNEGAQSSTHFSAAAGGAHPVVQDACKDADGADLTVSPSPSSQGPCASVQADLPTACSLIAQSVERARPLGDVLPVLVLNSLNSRQPDPLIGITVLKVSFVGSNTSAVFPFLSVLLGSLRLSAGQEDYLEGADRPSARAGGHLSGKIAGRDQDGGPGADAVKKLFAVKGVSCPQLETVYVDSTCKVGSYGGTCVCMSPGLPLVCCLRSFTYRAQHVRCKTLPLHGFADDVEHSRVFPVHAHHGARLGWIPGTASAAVRAHGRLQRGPGCWRAHRCGAAAALPIWPVHQDTSQLLRSQAGAPFEEQQPCACGRAPAPLQRQ